MRSDFLALVAVAALAGPGLARAQAPGPFDHLTLYDLGAECEIDAAIRAEMGCAGAAQNPAARNGFCAMRRQLVAHLEGHGMFEMQLKASGNPWTTDGAHWSYGDACTSAALVSARAHNRGGEPAARPYAGR